MKPGVFTSKRISRDPASWLRRVLPVLYLVGMTLFAAPDAPSKKVIIDCDPGIDDALALIMALQHPGLEILGITTGFGNTTLEQATQNALRIVEMSGKAIPVYRGAAKPMTVPLRPPPDFVHGKDGLGNSAQPLPKLHAQAQPAARFMSEAARRHPGEVTLLAIGRLSNLAEALRLDDSFAGLIREVVLMGGTLHVPGNVSPVAEANVSGDPHAADLVFTAPWKVTMVGLDVTTQVRLSDDMLSRVESGNTTFGTFIHSITRFYQSFHRDVEKVSGGSYVHDPSAVIYLVAPGLFKTQQGPLRVVSDGIAIGQTIMATQDHHIEQAPWKN